ncbi:hypothetical protein O181_129264, partial [Austropuccinia psidii MF-1]|nr:hypothetical protein [Austropuccinia psidii MF-1]
MFAKTCLRGYLPPRVIFFTFSHAPPKLWHLACSQKIPGACGLFPPEFCTRVRQRPGCQSRWISTRLKRHRGECICGSRLTAGAPFDHPTHSPLKAQYASVSKKLQAKPKSCSVACHRTYLTRPHTNIPTVRLPFETANIA